MNLIKLSTCFRKNNMQKLYLSLIMVLTFVAITAFSSPKTVHADTWSLTLPAIENPTMGRSYYCTNSNSGKISLTRIVNGPSYYMVAQMLNSNISPRTGETLVRQGTGYTNFVNSTMSYSYYYTLMGSNDYFETTSRSAYGYIDINSKKIVDNFYSTC